MIDQILSDGVDFFVKSVDGVTKSSESLPKHIII